MFDGGRASRPRPVRAAVLILIAFAAAAATAALATIGWPARDYLQGDFFQYWSGSHALLAGSDPYDPSWGARFSAASGSHALLAYPEPAAGPKWTTAYPLWTLIAFIPFALLPFTVASAAWLVAQILAVAVALAALVRTVLRAAPRRDGVILVGVALAFQPLWLLPGNGNVTGFVFAALALALALEARPLLSGGLLGTLAFKPQSVVVAAVAIVIAAVPRARARLMIGASAVAAVLGVVSYLVRPGWFADWIRSVSALQSSTGSNATLWTLGRATGLPALSIVAPAGALMLLVVWARLRRPPALLLVAAAIPVSIGLSPHGWTYDQLHLLITVAIGIEILSDMPDGARTGGVVALAVVAVALPWTLYAYDLAHDSEDWSALVPMFVLAWLLAVDRWHSTMPTFATRARYRPASPGA
ncbi:MAG: DUF2029 domain-containing protein [Chloroflexi bacterium]|nr:DUF2029 domain-containing protein [Chloroflexota bacterium]